jgi:hypothetical protein
MGQDHMNIVRSALEAMGMHPDGALIGGIGALIAVLASPNGHGWKASMAIISGGFTLGGYLLPVLQEHLQFLQGTVFFIIFVVGFVSRHVYEFLDSTAPQALRLAYTLLSEYAAKKYKKK